MAKIKQLSASEMNFLQECAIDAHGKLLKSEPLKRVTTLKVGSFVEGIVKERRALGFDVALGNETGFLSKWESTFYKVSDSFDLISPGMSIMVRIMNVKEGRIEVSRRQYEYWQLVYRYFEEGMITEGKIASLTSFGAHIDLGYGVEGFISNEELAAIPKEEGEERKKGCSMNVAVIQLDPIKNRVILGEALKSEQVVKSAIPNCFAHNCYKKKIPKLIKKCVTFASEVYVMEISKEEWLPPQEMPAKKISPYDLQTYYTTVMSLILENGVEIDYASLKKKCEENGVLELISDWNELNMAYANRKLLEELKCFFPGDFEPQNRSKAFSFNDSSFFQTLVVKVSYMRCGEFTL